VGVELSISITVYSSLRFCLFDSRPQLMDRVLGIVYLAHLDVP
jgi:hypothetical protein